jgi:hypothetical protein
LQVTVFSPELIGFSPVFSYFGQAAFVKKRPFLWAFESASRKKRIECPTAFASKLASTFELHFNVGASLLANRPVLTPALGGFGHD